MTKQLRRLALLAVAWCASTSYAAAGKTTTVTVTVPVGATLTINGHPTTQMTAVRLFVTPELSVGPKHRYIFEATFTWNGEEVVKRKQVDLLADTHVEIDMMLAATVVRPVVREEAEPTPPVETPKPLPKPEVKPTPATRPAVPPATTPRPEQPKPVEPKKPVKKKTPQPSEQPVPDPRAEQLQPAGSGKNAKPKPDPNDPSDGKRPVAPKPREIRS